MPIVFIIFRSTVTLTLARIAAPPRERVRNCRPWCTRTAIPGFLTISIRLKLIMKLWVFPASKLARIKVTNKIQLAGMVS